MVYRYLGIGEESTLGTAVATSKYKDIVSESLALNKRYGFPATVRDRSVTKKLTGPIVVQGDINMLLNTQPDAKFFYWALGSKSTTNPESGVYSHAITPADTIKSFTARLGAESLERIIAGCLIDNFQIEAVAGQPAALLTIGVIGRSEVKTTIGTPTFQTTDELNFSQGTVSIGGSARTYVRAFRVRVRNNINLDSMYVITATDGEKFNRIELSERTVEGSLDLQFPDSTEYDRFLATTDFAINAKFEGALAGPALKHKVEVDLPQCIYLSDVTPHIDRREPIRITAPFRAMYNATAAYDIKVTVVNTESAI